jgi:hypothetical protein
MIIILLSILNTPAYSKTIIIPNSKVLRTIYRTAKRANHNVNNLLKIAHIESGFNPQAIRHNKNRSVDYGLFQINSIHWSTTCKEFDIFTVEGNTQCAIKLIDQAAKYAKKDDHWLGRYHSKTPSRKQAYHKKINQIHLIIGF